MNQNIFYLHEHSDDFDEFCAKALHWDLEYRQIEAGLFSSEILTFGSASMIFSRAKVRRGVLQKGVAPKGLITIGMLADPKSHIHWRGIDVTGNMLFVFPANGELHSITCADFDVHIVSFTEKQLDRICTVLELPEFRVLLNKKEVFRCDLRMLAIFRQQLLFIEQTLIQGTGRSRSEQFLAQIEQELGVSVVKLLAESSQPVHKKTLRKRDIALKAAESFLLESNSEVVSIPELCIAANVSERTLQYAFQERYGLTPKAYSLIYRLNNVHQQLRKAIPGTGQIANIAQQNGFWHMGKFSADYKKMFAMLPSETLKRKI